MSVLINSTTITIKNTTDYLIEIECETDQDEAFHVRSNHELIEEREQSSSLVNTLFEYLYGSKLKKVILNLQAGKEATLTINSKSQLEFKYEAKIKNSNEHISGYLPISTEYQGLSLIVNMVENKGIWKDFLGNVAIVGRTKPNKRDIGIYSEIMDSLKNKIHIDEYNPAFCKITVNDL